MLEYEGVEIHWLRHAGFKIKSKETTLYIDPYQISGDLEPADVLLISHTHFDHFEEASIKKIANDQTEVVCSHDAVQNIKKWVLVHSIKSLLPGEKAECTNVKIEAHPAYNTDKEFHPKENQWLGFLIHIDGVKIYFVGDTDPLEELKGIECDIALVPVSGIYLMDPHQAADFVKTLKVSEASIPMHWGTVIDDQGRHVGTLEDAKAFCEKVPHAKILDAECK